jgi:hypothetical protein
MIMMKKGLILVIQNVAIAYIDIWYPGQIISEENSHFTVKFLHPGSGKGNVFKWPDIEDISVIDQLFVFFADFKILPKDSMGRAWYIPTYSEFKKHYMLYSKKFFQ